MPDRIVPGGSFQLVLEGVTTGLLKSVEGGFAVAEVVPETVGTTMFPKKHLGRIDYKARRPAAGRSRKR